MQQIPDRWRFSFDNELVSASDLAWSEAVRVFHSAEAGELAGQSSNECVTLEFNMMSGAVLYMGGDQVILRPYLLRRSEFSQALGPCFCECCGVRLGNQTEYLARFLLTRDDALRLFAAVLAGPPLPSELPDPDSGLPVLPGFQEVVEEIAGQRAIEWRPLPAGERTHPTT